MYKVIYIFLRYLKKKHCFFGGKVFLKSQKWTKINVQKWKIQN